MQSRKEVAAALAAAHRREDPGTAEVRWYEGGDQREIRLLEASASVAGVGEVFPVRFKPTSDVPYATVVVLVSPEELRQIDDGSLELPEGWTEPKVVP